MASSVVSSPLSSPPHTPLCSQSATVPCEQGTSEPSHETNDNEPLPKRSKMAGPEVLRNSPVHLVGHADLRNRLAIVDGDVDKYHESISGFSSSQASTFGLGVLPRGTDWMVEGADRHLNVLSYLGTPVTFLVVGRLRSLTIYVGTERWNAPLRLSVAPTSAAARDTLLRLFRFVNSAHPGTTDGLWRGVVRNSIQNCTTVYDASEAFDWTVKKPWGSVVDLRVDDLVVVECSFVRKETSGSYSAEFRVNVLSLLRRQGV